MGTKISSHQSIVSILLEDIAERLFSLSASSEEVAQRRS